MAAALLALVAILFASVGAVAWLVYQPTTADTLIYRSFVRARALDPSHASLYEHAYRQVAAHTRYNDLHYAVHEVAGRVAWLTGHPNAAFVQWHRAGYHRPRPGRSPLYWALQSIGPMKAKVVAAFARR